MLNDGGFLLLFGVLANGFFFLPQRGRMVVENKHRRWNKAPEERHVFSFVTSDRTPIDRLLRRTLQRSDQDCAM
jgi:hypothetical protein